MAKDAKGHGSAKRTFEVRQGDKTYKGLHSSIDKAKEAAHHHGITRPDTARLVESKATQAANRKKAVVAAGMLGVRSTTKNEKY